MTHPSEPVKKLNLDDLKWQSQYVGKLEQKVIDAPNLMDLTQTEIHMGRDRVKYIEKHKNDFLSEESWRTHVEAIPDIIQNPDYVGIHPGGDGIEFIKQIDEICLVAVRIKMKGKLWVRSVYPLTKKRLDNFIRTRRCIRYP